VVEISHASNKAYLAKDESLRHYFETLYVGLLILVVFL
jgi:hypothetical protein